ncbi:MAG: adenylyl-sulfate kinase [Nitrospiraceae bacterium]|nr:MAG: adenylyl-sulfate kinase [Nitrospiraceae bacterium]
MSWVLWITGLSGCGKSTVALKVKELFPHAVILQMDDLRKIVTPAPTYSEEEREYVYRALVYTAKTLCEAGHNVIIDATGNRRSWRQLARELISDYMEVYLECPVEVCVKREKTRLDTHAAPAGIYEKGKEGWPVPGINVPYEEPDKPELIIDTEKEPPEKAAEKIIRLVKNR